MVCKSNYELNSSKVLCIEYLAVVLLNILFSFSAFADNTLPNPLTLNYALATANGDHPDIQLARANIASRQAQIALVESNYGVNSYLHGRIRYIDPVSVDPDKTRDDHKIGLIVSKRLYDFGRTSAAESAAQIALKSQEDLYSDELNQHRLRIMAGFFNVLLADLHFIRDNEAMSVAFIRMDRVQMKNELGQVSDVDVLEAESAYQKIRRNFYASRSMQRSSRSQLANLLNRPGELSKDLEEPNLQVLKRKIPEYEQLESQVLQMNPMLIALRGQVLAAEQRVDAARAGARPLLNGELELAEYTRETRASNNNWKIGVTIDIPLLSGGSVKASVAKQQADLRRAQADLQKQKMHITQTLLESWQLLDTLRIQREETKSTMNYRDLALDESRALYELEVKADLGDSMVQVSTARLLQAEANYRTALAWARIDALLGKEVNPESANVQ